MAKMAELHAEGVTDLFSYQQGQIDKALQILHWIKTNRTEVAPGVLRDNFTSENLEQFIEAQLSE